MAYISFREGRARKKASVITEPEALYWLTVAFEKGAHQEASAEFHRIGSGLAYYTLGHLNEKEYMEKLGI